MGKIPSKDLFSSITIVKNDSDSLLYIVVFFFVCLSLNKLKKNRMFVNFPTKSKRKVVVVVKNKNQNSVTSTSSLTIKKDNINDNSYLQNLKKQNDNYEKIVKSNNTRLEILNQEIFEKQERIKTLEKLQTETKKTRQVDDKIAVVTSNCDTFKKDNEYLYKELENIQDSIKETAKELKNVKEKMWDLLNTFSSEEFSTKKNVPDITMTIDTLLIFLEEKLKKDMVSQAKTMQEISNNSFFIQKLTQEKNELILEKDKTISQEKSNVKACQDMLETAQKELKKQKSDFFSFTRENSVSVSEKNELKKKLDNCKQNFNTLEKTYKTDMINSNRESKEKINMLKLENQQLKSDVEKIKKVNDTISKSGSKENLDSECDKIQVKLLTIIPYISRQVEIFNISKNKTEAKNDVSWKSFVLENLNLYIFGDNVIKEYATKFSVMNCSEIIEFFKEVLSIYSEMEKLENRLVNLFEDLAGSVRVYVRIKPLGNKIDQRKIVEKIGNNVLYNGAICTSNISIKTFGKFFGVIPDTFKTQDVYTGCAGTITSLENLEIKSHQKENEKLTKCCIMDDSSGFCRVVDQLKTGYHVILFGYGFSGAGKTMTLLGDETGLQPGLAQLAIANSGAKNVNVRSIFEMTFKNIDFRNRNFNSGQFVQLFTRGEKVLQDFPKEMTSSETTSFNDFLQKNNFDFIDKNGKMENPLKSRGITASGLFQLKKLIDLYRIDKKRIKATVNNPESSRSHLFIVLEFEFSNNEKGYLTITDMGGRESSIEILSDFFEKPAEKPWQVVSMLMTPPLIPKYVKTHFFTKNDPALSWYYDKDRYENDTVYKNQFDTFIANLNNISKDTNSVLEVVKESVFINETINQLTYFFQQKQNIVSDIKETRFPLDDQKNSYDTKKFLMNVPTEKNDKIGMYKILTVLSNLWGSKSKFVMMCMIRQEASPTKFCLATKETLEFASSVKST